MGSALDVVGLLDEVYAPGRAQGAWLAAIAAAAAPALDQGGGLSCHYVDLPAQAAAAQAAAQRGGGEARTAEAQGAALAPEHIGMPLYYPGAPGSDASGRRWPCGFLGDYPGGQLTAALRPLLDEADADDALGVSAVDAAGRGCLLVAPVPRGARPRPLDRPLWSRLGAHLAAGLRLCLSPPGAAEASFDPQGRPLFADGEAATPAAQRALCAAAARQLRARDRRGAARPLAGLWAPLVAARWTLRRGPDGGLLALRNAPAVPGGVAALVRGAAALGHDAALIAYESGLSLPMVRRLLAAPR